MEWIQKKLGKQQENHKAHIKSKEFYEFYARLYFKSFANSDSKRAIINKQSPYNIPYDVYCKILSDLNSGIAKLILTRNFEFNMPYRLGTLSIKKKKLTPYIDKEGNFVNNLPVDWKETWALWRRDKNAYENKKLVRFTNEHTKGYIGRWYYSKRVANYPNKGLYTFIPCRTSKTELGSILKDENNNIDYYEL